MVNDNNDDHWLFHDFLLFKIPCVVNDSQLYSRYWIRPFHFQSRPYEKVFFGLVNKIKRYVSSCTERPQTHQHENRNVAAFEL